MGPQRSVTIRESTRMAHLENFKPNENRRTSTTCECGMERSMKHILQCPICPYSCTQDDVMNANDNAKDVASFWAETI
ncbi:hypothetical protein QTP88_029202 [Uroleucon formosanum]